MTLQEPQARPVIIFGAGQLAEIAAFYFNTDTERDVAAFVVDDDSSERRFCGRPVVDLASLGDHYPTSEFDAFVAIGYSRCNAVREEKCKLLLDRGYRLANYVSSRAVVFANVEIGSNCFILEHNTVQPFVHLGSGVTLWSGNHIGHHSQIGDYAFISSHVVVSGNCTVGARSFLGVNSTLNDGVSIGTRCVIGSGSLIVRDIADEGVTTAQPAELSRVPSSRLRGF